MFFSGFKSSLLTASQGLFLLLSIVLGPLVSAQDSAIISYDSRFHPVIGQQGMVASQEALASEVGLEILKQGGNAVDAAVATGFAMAVTLPKAGNIGGGGFMMIYLKERDKVVALDYREMAPIKAYADMFLDKDGNFDRDMAGYTYRAGGVPGTVAGMIHALENYGTMKLAQVIAPAIKLAKEGFIVTPGLANDLVVKRKRLTRYPATKEIFYHSDGRNLQAGERLIQKDLAWSLSEISKHGKSAFYGGSIAKKFVSASDKYNGLFTLDDFKGYKVVEREAVKGNYRGYDVVSMPPPSSGGVHLIQMLNVLEAYDLKLMGHNSAEYLHTLTETMRRAYADRSQHLGDPDFYRVPVAKLLDKQYAKTLRQQIDPNKATPSEEVAPTKLFGKESNDTTHYSVADRWGNIVSNTYTINYSYGSGIVVDGTGILLNNEMDDFSAKPGEPNAYGLLGSEANAIEPRKRPLSSMTPTLVIKDGQPVLATGSPGGSTIITIVLQIVLNTIDFEMNIAEATSVPRMHHQWFPDKVFVEPGVSKDTVELLKQNGHDVKYSRTMGSTQSIATLKGYMYGASDTRRPDAATVAY
ncbi:gamma-glutamyltransferase [uncultured Pseudoteredinibacter sp.]|uniref:gamma-glutamyltransferase n=1 Tax=uncultured Pseudoteredinibacter sp. TaxID=1641701 RepID=UPI0026376514|nr:gamma-glutamyltransferase [uncultured Pseudoteredinibacter sp.]